MRRRALFNQLVQGRTYHVVYFYDCTGGEFTGCFEGYEKQSKKDQAEEVFTSKWTTSKGKRKLSNRDCEVNVSEDV